MAQPPLGVIGWAVDRMIRRSVRRAFRNVYWKPPESPPERPTIFVANHHGWFDGYLMYLALCRLDLRGTLDWIQEYDAFPWFGRLGGMPYPSGDPMRRALTVRRTVRAMREENRCLLLFAEGILHRPPELLPFGRSLEFVALRVPRARIIPVGIKYEHALHERPEAYVWFGDPVDPGSNLAWRSRLAVAAVLDRTAVALASDPSPLSVLHAGTKDINERMDMRKIPRVFGRRPGR